MPITQKDLTHAKSEHVNIEFWGSNMGEGDYARPNNGNNTYKALRVVAKDYDIAYMVWCTNEHELYNMKVCTPAAGRLHISLTSHRPIPYKCRIYGALVTLLVISILNPYSRGSMRS